MVGLRQQIAFHHDVDVDGRSLSASEREKMLAGYLPEEPVSRAQSPSRRPKTKRTTKGVQGFLRLSLHVLIFNIIHLVFSIYIRLRRAYRNVATRIQGVLYYHHRTPELIQRDVKDLEKTPKHLSIILDVGKHGQDGAAVEGLVNDVCECAAWSACAGIPMLSIYERTGKTRAVRRQ